MARKPTIQDIFVRHFDEVRDSAKLSTPQQRAGHAIVACRTEAMGGHEQRCPDGHFVRTQYHSCRHRSCPTCAEKAKGEWLDRQQDRLLPCDHFHVIFTVPHELLPLWRYNRREFTDALFGACRDTLVQLLGQDRHLGATPGVVMALHTWGRTLNQHPHIHCLVTAGGMTPAGEWRDVPRDYLLPAGVVKPIYRGKLLAKLSDAMRGERLRAPEAGCIEDLLRAAAGKKWNVRLESRYGHGKGVAKYLSRYVRGGPIANTRVVGAGDGQVRFRYKDHRDGKCRIRCLAASRFVEHLLWHVPEPGQHTVRHVGLYAHACRARRERCRRRNGLGRVRFCDMLSEVWPLPGPRGDDCLSTAAETKFPITVERTLYNKTFNRTRSEPRSAVRRHQMTKRFFELDAGRLTTRWSAWLLI